MKFFHLYKKELFSFLVCFCLFLIVSFFTYSKLIHKYKESYLLNQSMLINHILKIHPELEYEILESFHSMDQNEDLTILKKYGFLNEKSLSQLEFISKMESKSKQIIFFSFLFCFFLFLSLIFYFYFQRERKINEIHEYLFGVLKNDYQVNLKDYREDSLSMLKSDLLKVTNKLRNATDISLKSKKNLEQTLSDISHQLRTPLTSLSIIHDVLKNQNLKKEERNRFLNEQKEQLNRMEWLIVTLLKMSQIDSGTILFSKKQNEIKQILEEALKPILIPLELKQIEFLIEVDPKLTCSLDYHWTIEAFSNLFKNAMEHTCEQGKIEVNVIDNPLYVEVLVSDNGSGIAKEDLSHIFERFYKGKTKSDSIGIGLNLTKSIIEKQNGTIRVISELGVGTTFIIHFYKVTI